MIGKDMELLKVYVPKTVKRKLEEAASMAGVKTSSFSCAVLTKAVEWGGVRELTIDHLESAIRVEDEAIKTKVAAKLAELKQVA